MYSVLLKRDIIKEDAVRFLETTKKTQLVGHVWLQRSVYDEMGEPTEIKIKVGYF